MSATNSASSRKIPWLFALMVAGCCQLFVAAANAALIPIPAPPSVSLGALPSQNNTGYIFFESFKVLPAPLSVDVTFPGLYNANNSGTPGVIAQGTSVLSFMIHHQSPSLQLGTLTGGWIFPGTIIGIIFEDLTLDASDPVVGNPGTLYPTGLGFRGFDLTTSPVLPDTIFWSGNSLVIVQSNTQTIMDQLRVIVVPVPGTLWLAAVAFCGLFFSRYRARRS